MLNFLVLCGLLPLAKSHSVEFNSTRCRSSSDFQKIPWINRKSTFHHLGFPLVQSLCETGDKQSDKLLNCRAYSSIIWPRSSSQESRSGPESSTIIVDPPLRDDGGESSGVFVMNAIYAIFYELGYKPMIRYWSDSLNTHFPADAANYATNVSTWWDSYSEGHGENPFESVKNYVSFQSEVGVAFYHRRAPKPINDSPFGRTFKWIIGYHHRNKFHHYEHNAQEMHCLGANHQLGEGLFCSSSSVIACPMFAFHHKKSLRVTPENRASLKENVVLIDSDAVRDINDRRLEQDLKRLGLHDVRVLVHHKRKRHEVPEVYAMTKVSLDCRNPGVEFINYEATLYDVLTLSCNSRATSNAFDFPVPSKYRLEPSNWPKLVQLVHDLLVNYESHLPEFQTFKALSRNSHSMIANQLDVNFFSRDVLFRTYCATYSECRRTISWAVIIWILYPLARIEVFTEIPHDQYQHDNDVPLEMLARTFNPKFFKLIEWSAEKQTKHAAMQPPQSPCTFVVYMDPSLVPFGRDFLSTHMRAFSSSTGSSGSRGSDDQPPIAYWSGQRLVLLIRHNNKPIANTLKITGADKVIAWYFANAGVARPIDSLEALQAMEKSGVTRLETTQQYLEGFTIGPDIKLEEFMSMPNMGDVDLQAPQPGIFITGAAPTAELVVDALWIPEVASQVSISEPLHTLRTKSKATAVEPEIRAGQGTKLTGNYPALLTSEAQLWLTPAVRVPLQTVLGGSSGGGSGAFTQAQLEAIVQHLDPILQSALLQKIFGFIPPDMSRVLKMFDAAHFPRVVSLIDAKSDSWGEQC